MCGRMSCTLHPRRLYRVAGLVPVSGSSASEQQDKKEGDARLAVSAEPLQRLKVEQEEATGFAPSLSSSSAALFSPTKTEEKGEKLDINLSDSKSSLVCRSSSPSSLSASRASAGLCSGEETSSLELLRPRFNVSPTCAVPIIEEARGIRRLRAAEWALRVPGQPKGEGKTPAYSTFNARAEGLTQSRLYRRLLDTRRCVVVADGFYEWKKPQGPGESKQPFFIRHKASVAETAIPGGGREAGELGKSESSCLRDEATARPLSGKRARDTDVKHEDGEEKKRRKETSAPETIACASEGSAEWQSVLKEGEAPLLFAGLFEDDASPDAHTPATGRDCSATILTMDSASTPMADIHSRMPILLSPADASRWLNTNENPFSQLFPDILGGCQQLYRTTVDLYPVTARVGNSRYESADCVLPLPARGPSKVSPQKPRGMRTLDFFLRPAEKKKPS
ncbi:UNVERIFIED_CONTAM: ACR, COG2135 domain-containing protein [Hammondia hammondi]|eukprot:XP_008888317.1 ACR, COG2135 domain-containing protein [Hammondia hammondi]